MTSIPLGDSLDQDFVQAGERESLSVRQILSAICMPLASLRLTVTLFAMGAFIVLAGTLAQVEMGIWDVMKTYFRSYIVWIPLQVFFPPNWFPSMADTSGGFYFAGGRSIGLALLVNIFAAHLLRFKVQASGSKLWTGIGIMAIGAVITTLVILYGNWKDGVQDQPMFRWEVLWYAILAGLGLLLAVSLFSLVGMARGGRLIEVTIIGCGILILGGLLAWLLLSGKMLDDASMRIVWNLIQGSIASLVLLVGSAMVFKKRGGIVVLHAGVALLIFNELWVSSGAVEEQMTIEEGKVTNVARDVRSVELTVTDRSNPEFDLVVAIPQSRLQAGAVISHKDLPFDMRVDYFFRNSTYEILRTDDDKPTVRVLNDGAARPIRPTQGLGMRVRLIQMPLIGGVDASKKQDRPSAYVTLLEKSTESAKPPTDRKEIATVLLSDLFQHAITTMPDRGETAEVVQLNEKPYELWLHYKRSYKPYQLALHDVRKEDYVGTSIPKKFESDFTIIDSVSGDHESTIRMNEPLRYKGETFYQSGYNENAGEPGTREISTLQIVTNDGWMIPYVSCMIVGFGMLAQFAGVLLRFLRRKDVELIDNMATPESGRSGQFSEWIGSKPLTDNGGKAGVRQTGTGQPVIAELAGSALDHKPGVMSDESGMLQRLTTHLTSKAFLHPFGAALLLGICLLLPTVKNMLSSSGDELKVQVENAGEIPIAHGGRVMPLGSLARIKLEAISERQEIYYIDKDYESQKIAGREPADGDLIDWKKHSATEWMMDVIARRDRIDDVRIFRIYDLNLLSKFKLKRRKGYRYSFNELRSKRKELEQEVEQTRALDAKTHTPYHKALQKLASSYFSYNQLRSVTMTPEDLQRERMLEMGEDEPELADKELLPGFVRFAMNQKEGMSERALPMFAAVAYTEAEKAELARENEAAGKSAAVDGGTWETLTAADARSRIMLAAHEHDLKSTREVGELFFNNIVGPEEEMIAQKIDAELMSFMAGQIRQMNPGIEDRDLRQQLAVLMERSQEMPMFQKLKEQLRPSVIAEIEQTRQRFVDEIVEFAGGEEVTDPKTMPGAQLAGVFAGYRNGNAQQMADSRQAYLATVQQIKPRDFKQYKIDTERTYSALSPFYNSIVLYVAGFVFAACGWVGWTQRFNRIAFWLIFLGVVVHGFGIYERVMISGRPPVTNLYSSAIFIGWTIAILGLLIQVLFRIGVGNVLAAVGGTVALLIARNLAVGQDTFQVVVAVLDTQFWLATHVLCITLGYTTTYAAGLLGIQYLVRRVMVPTFSEEQFKDLPRMIYGITCFAILFSFVGTVLGGLWGDDSWGRFWGWDPKENGALIIVIWNALILHARWGGMVRARGLAVLAVAGCSVTTWSWFGVNQLGVGMHSYGFTEGALATMGLAMGFFTIVMCVGMLPQQLWISNLLDFRKKS